MFICFVRVSLTKCAMFTIFYKSASRRKPDWSYLQAMKVNDVLQCSFGSWYSQFASLTTESAVVPIPADVLQFLTADGIFITGEDEDEAGASASRNVSNLDTLNPEFKQEVNGIIERLGNEVFPKLNWSSPKDAAWISPSNSLKCTNVDEVLILLKSSDFVTHDLTEPFLECQDADGNTPAVQYTLVLRRWVNIQKYNEFRCFVKDRDLVAISQRHVFDYFPALAEGDYKSQLAGTLTSFYQDFIKAKFPLDSFVFDVYLEYGKFILLDFNPWGIVTDSLMFTWTELESMNSEGQASAAASSALKSAPELTMRVRELRERRTIPRIDPFSGFYGVPLEYHKLAMDAEQGKQPFDTLLELMQAQKIGDDEDMEDDRL